MQRILRFVLYLSLAATSAGAQEIQNAWSYRNIASDRYFRVNYENDLPFHTDYYFTQGAHFELVVRRLPTRSLFPEPKHSSIRYGIGLESAGYTPTSIVSDTILYGDRPFAGTAYLKAFMMATNAVTNSRLSAALTLGLMGPAAAGYEIQAAIHRRTGNVDPIGWKYQVGNSLILNYELVYERALPLRRGLLLSGTGMLRAGTYSIKAAIGGVLMAGRFDNPFGPVGNPRKLQAYLFAHPQLNIVGYNATLQGGLFTSNSPYVISHNDLSRLLFRGDAGFRIGYRNAWLSAYARYLSKEFSTGRQHAMGGIELAIPLSS